MDRANPPAPKEATPPAPADDHDVTERINPRPDGDFTGDRREISTPPKRGPHQHGVSTGKTLDER